MSETGRTRERIQRVARELFRKRACSAPACRTSPTRLGITKPALYYHFSSREDLVRSILQPLMDEGERFVAEHEEHGSATPRELLEGYFDYHYRYRADLVLVVSELTHARRPRSDRPVAGLAGPASKLVFGPAPTLQQATRAVIAFGGLQDCCLQFPDAPHDELRRATVDGAMAALGISGGRV